LKSLREIQREINRSIEHLSTGLRITSASDDPSGVVIAHKFMAQIGGTRVAMQNAEEAVSLVQTAFSVLEETSELLLRMRDLALRAMNDATLTTSDYTNLNDEFDALRTEITRKANATTFNSRYLLTGAYASGQMAQVGPANIAAHILTIVIRSGQASAFANGDLANVLLISDAANSAPGHAGSALSVVDDSLDELASIQASLGIQERRLNSVVDDLQSMETNMVAARSRITDADMASEISHFAKLQILSEATVATLAQANDLPERVVSLLEKMV
ncbi:MAG: flagellin, partial [bacterium]